MGDVAPCDRPPWMVRPAHRRPASLSRAMLLRRPRGRIGASCILREGTTASPSSRDSVSCSASDRTDAANFFRYNSNLYRPPVSSSERTGRPPRGGHGRWPLDKLPPENTSPFRHRMPFRGHALAIGGPFPRTDRQGDRWRRDDPAQRGPGTASWPGSPRPTTIACSHC